MKKLLAVFIILFAAANAHAADDALLSKARAEGKVAFYANITSVEPIMEDFHRRYRGEGGVHAGSRPPNSWPRP